MTSMGYGVGELSDVLVAAAGTVDALLVAQDAQIRRIEPAGARIGYVAAA